MSTNVDFDYEAGFFFVLDKDGKNLRGGRIKRGQLKELTPDKIKAYEGGYIHSSDKAKNPSSWRVPMTKFAEFISGELVAEDPSVASEPEEKPKTEVPNDPPAKEEASPVVKTEEPKPEPEPAPSKTAPYSPVSAEASAKAEVKVVVPASTEAPPVVTAPIPAAPTMESEEDCKCLCEEEVQRLINSSMESFRKKLNEKESNWSSGLEQSIREDVAQQVEDLLRQKALPSAAINEVAIAALVADEITKALANQPKPSIDSSDLEAAVKPIAGKAVDEALRRKAWGNGGGSNVTIPSQMNHNHTVDVPNHVKHDHRHTFVAPSRLIWLVAVCLLAAVAVALIIGFHWKPEVQEIVKAPTKVSGDLNAAIAPVMVPTKPKPKVIGKVKVSGNATNTAPTKPKDTEIGKSKVNGNSNAVTIANPTAVPMLAPAWTKPKVQRCAEGLAMCLQKAKKAGLNEHHQRVVCFDQEGCK